MSPAAADFSNPVSSSQPFSQNPNPSYPGSNGTCRPQSRSFNFDDKDSNSGLSFDFSKKGSNFLGQPKPPRIRVPVKKKREKLSCENKYLFKNGLGLESLNPANEASGCTNSACDNVFSGSLGAKGGGVEIRKFGKLGFDSGANGYSFVSNLKNENEGLEFGANKDSSVLNSKNQNGGVMFGSEKNSLQSDLNPKNDGFLFGADKISSAANLGNGNLGSAFGGNKSNSILNPILGKGNGVFGANSSDSTLNSSLGNENFVFGASKSYLNSNSNLGHRESSGTVGESGAYEPKVFDNAGFVFGAKNGQLEQTGSNNDCYLQSGVKEAGKFSNMGFDSGASRTRMASENTNPVKEDHGKSVEKTIPDMRGKVKLVAGEVSGRDGGHSSFVFGKDHSGFVFGAKMSDSRSKSESGKSKIKRCTVQLDSLALGKNSTDTGNEFQKADVNGVLIFGSSIKEKPSSHGSCNNRDDINRLYGEKAENGSAFMKSPADAIRSNFKFVIGSDSSPGSAFYKIPLSKLFDEMKGLNIDNSEGINADEVKVAGSNSCFSTDNMFHSNDQTSGSVSGKENRISNSTEKISNANAIPQDQPIFYSNSNKTPFSSSFSAGSSSHVQQNGFGFVAPSTAKVENKGNLDFTPTPVGPDACSGEWNSRNVNESSSFTANLFPGLSIKSEFNANSRYLRDKRLKKTGKLRQRILAKHSTEQDHVSKDGSSPNNYESPGHYSPMDFSPPQDITDNAESFASMATDKKNENISAGKERSDINESNQRCGEQDNVSSKVQQESSFKSFPSSSAQDGLSAIRRQYRKKYKLKVGDGLSRKTTVQSSDCFSSSAQFSPNASNSSHISKARVQNGLASNFQSKADGQRAKQDPAEGVLYGASEQWRIRGNQAYKIRDLPKAEEYYTKGINAVEDNNVSGFSIEPMLLCYSNRAATRMSLGRMREALEDCKSAAALDPSFLKVKIRAANCHLVLGEFQEAMQYYNSCLESGTTMCLDRRIIIEAADGLQKAQRVSEYMRQSAELLQQKNSDAAGSVISKIVEGLSISCYSENLLEMKAEALFLLRRYDEVIELCEQTLDTAEKNFSVIHLSNGDNIEYRNSAKLWRWCLMSKSHFHLGRLELALDLIEKQEQLTSIGDRSASVNQGPLIPLAATIHELLRRKKAGNEAFQTGKHTEAVEHYTAAISSSVDSRPFAAICFCNRAAAHQALGLIADAIADCCLAIALDGDYVKALSRRATLHEMIRDYKQAITDLQRLISLLENKSQEKTQKSSKQDGSSRSNTKELKQALRRLSLIEDKAKKGTPMDFYLILGIKASDTESDVKKAYRKAALKHHPDKAGQYLVRNDSGDDGRSWKDIVEKVHEDADRLFKMIGEAYAVLSDSDKRSKYDYEEEIRDFCSDNNRNSDSGRPSDFYSSPCDRSHSSGRQSNFSGSPFGGSRSGRYWQESSRSYTNSHSRR